MEEMLRIRLKGLDCAHCAAKIEEEVKKMEELKAPRVNLLKQELLAQRGEGYIPGETLEKVKGIVSRYEPDVEVSFAFDDEKIGDRENVFQKELQKKLIRFGIGLILFFAAGVTKGNVSFGLYLASYAIFGGDVLWTAARNIAKGKVFDENFLMSVSTLGAIFLKEMPEAVFVMLFYQIGETFQSYAVDRSRKSIAGLMELRPDSADLVTPSGTVRVNPSEVAVGDLILVKPGEKIPLDGVVAEGAGQLDMAALTGESLPKEVGEGDGVYSGSVNRSGVIKIRVTKPFGESTVVKILELVETASEKKSKTEQFITKFAEIYTPLVVGAAVFLALLPPLVLGGGFQMWLGRALIFLVISCPCALVLSVPLGFFSGIGEASRRGILVKGSNYLSALKDVDTVVFDKTGTLTKGVFTVTESKTGEGFEKESLLKLAAAAEGFSNHPIAKSIAACYEKKYGAMNQEVQQYEELGGYGVSCVVGGKKVLVGNGRLMEKENIPYEAHKGVGTVVYVAEDGKYVGRLLVADTLKEGSKKTVERLRAMGVTKIIMLTGDNEETAKSISKELGLDGCYSGLLPQDKVMVLESLLGEKGKGKVLFVGDGINDAPVLARADVGVAMGGMGSDAAIEAADLVIMNDEVEKIADAMVIATNTNRIVNQNIVFALAVKLLVLALGAMGIATMWMAVFADVGVAFLAILNSMRKKYNPNSKSL